MKIKRVRRYRGPSIYSTDISVIKPIVLIEDSDHIASSKIDSILSEFEIINQEDELHADNIWDILPSLTLALLQNSGGKHLQTAKSLNKSDTRYEYIVEMDLEPVAVSAAYESVNIINDLIKGEKPNISKILEELSEERYRYDLGPSTKSIVKAAQDRDIPTIRLDQYSLVQLGFASKNRKIEAATTDDTSFVGMEIAQSKLMSKIMLQRAKLPYVQGEMVVSKIQIESIVEQLGFPLVVKPADASKGRGVTTNIENIDDIYTGYEKAKEFSEYILIEQFVEGRDYRVLVAGGEVLAVAERIPAHVIGDGEKTVSELIKLENNNPLRGEGHELPLTKISVDSSLKKTLESQNMDLETVPKEGEFVQLKPTANLSTGGIAIDRSKEIHPDNEEMVIRSSRIVGLDVCGIDLITTDISKSLWETGGKIIELNTAPGLRMHLFPTEGEAQNVGEKILDTLFSKGENGRIPIVAITGTNGKTTVTLLTSHILRLDGKRIGMITTEGIHVQGTRIFRGDCTGPWSSGAILRDPTVDIGVFETARGGILKRGLGFDRTQVSVFLNVSEEHLGEHGINTVDEMAEVKALLYDIVDVDGYGVINCSDDRVWKESKRIEGKKIGFSIDPDNPRLAELEEQGFPYITVKSNRIVIVDSGRSIEVSELDAIPLTYEGIAEFNIENVLAACAVAYSMDVSVDVIQSGLLSFSPTPELNPGRANLIRIGNSYIFVDYAHNIAAMKLIARFLGRLKSRWGLRTLKAVVSLPGNRREVEYYKIMRIIADSFDEIYIKEDKDLRERERGEMTEILSNTLLESGFPEDHIYTGFVEPEGLQQALQDLHDDDLIFVNFEDVDIILSTIREFKRKKIGGL
ncbi:MAG: putative Cyanophycin synthetase [Candidatus Thorarchaeota archaeon]|nr:MAG: putative Cyanophycin synthetase [Candidatus Thorarchaeota archaeon]